MRGEGARLSGTPTARCTSISSAGSRSARSGIAIQPSSRRSRGQSERLLHASNLFYTEPVVRLAERLCGSSLGGKAFFTNSGTEANECAIKLARKHAHGRGIEDSPRLSASTAPSTVARSGARWRRPRRWRPIRVPRARCWPALSQYADRRSGCARRSRSASDTAAVMIEPIQGESGHLRDPGRDTPSPPARPATALARCLSSTRSRPGWGGPARSGPTSRRQCAPT